MDEVRHISSGSVLALWLSPLRLRNSINIFVWSVALLCHAAAKSFGDLFACRAFLGICEGAITPGFLIVTSMFYTRKEQSQRVGYWCTYPRLNPLHSQSLTLFSLSPHEWHRYHHARPHCVRHTSHQDR